MWKSDDLFGLTLHWSEQRIVLVVLVPLPLAGDVGFQFIYEIDPFRLFPHRVIVRGAELPPTYAPAHVYGLTQRRNGLLLLAARDVDKYIYDAVRPSPGTMHRLHSLQHPVKQVVGPIQPAIGIKRLGDPCHHPHSLGFVEDIFIAVELRF